MLIWILLMSFFLFQKSLLLINKISSLVPSQPTRYVELLWISAVMQLALDQDPLVCINVSPPTCSKVLHSDAIPEYPSEHKCFPYLIRTSFPHFLSLQLHSGSVFLGCFVSSDH